MRNLPQIDLMKSLVARLGKTKVDRIRYHQRGRNSRQSGAVNIINELLEEVRHISHDSVPAPIADVLYGAAALDQPGTDKPLSWLRLLNIFQCMAIINSREIQVMMNISPRQARRYMVAVRVAMPHLVRVVRKPYGEEEKEAQAKGELQPQ